MADTAIGHDVTFPTLDGAQRQGLREALGPMVALANPLDYHTFIWTDVPRMAATFGAMLGGDIAMGCLVADFPREDRCDPVAWDCIYEAGEEATKQTGKPLAIVATLPDAMTEAVTARIIAGGMVPLLGLDEALTAIAVAARLGQPRPEPEPLLHPGEPAELHTLSEAEAKAELAAHGVTIPAAKRAANKSALEEAVRDIGTPLVIKAEGLAHKTEAGGVAFAREDTAAAVAQAAVMPCESWLVEEMIDGTVAELLIGVTRDPAHGYVLTLAAGGILTEIMGDSASLLLPATEDEIAQALNSLRIARVLRGYRGKPGADMGAIAQAVLAVQSYVAAHAGRLEEVEINPLICTETRAVAVDALITIGGNP